MKPRRGRPRRRAGIPALTPTLLTPALLALALLVGCRAEGPLAAGGGPAGHQATLLPGGTTIAFRGDITFGSAQALLTLVRANPQVDQVRLASDGGYVHPALLVANALQLRGATTVVEGSCLSACTVLFVGGKRRYLVEGGALGFHRAWRDEEEEQESRETEATNQELRARFIARGVAPAFADRVLATPGSEMWYPTQQELLAAGVIDAVLPKGARP